MDDYWHSAACATAYSLPVYTFTSAEIRRAATAATQAEQDGKHRNECEQIMRGVFRDIMAANRKPAAA